MEKYREREAERDRQRQRHREVTAFLFNPCFLFSLQPVLPSEPHAR